MRPRFSPLLFVLACGWSLVCAAEANDHLSPLPDLVSARHWRAPAADAGVTIGDAPRALAIGFDAEPGRVADLFLQSPVPIPDGFDDLSVTLSADLKLSQFGFDIILADANGRHWHARTKLPGANEYHGTVGQINTGQLKGRSVRLSAPGLSQPSNKRFFREENKEQANPPRPWSWVGLRLIGERLPHHPKEAVNVYLNGFILGSQAPRHSAYTGIRAEITGKPTAYAGLRTEFCVELDGEPGVSAASFYSGPGAYEIYWEIYRDYAGRPVASGIQSMDIRVGEGTLPLPLQLAQRVTLPRQELGTSWIRWRAHRYPQGGAKRSPLAIASGEERLYVHVAAPGQAAPAVISAPPDGWLLAAPLGGSYAVDNPKEFGALVSLKQPRTPSRSPSLKITARTNHLRTEVFSETRAVEFDAEGAAEIAVSLAALPPGPYKLELAYLDGGTELDRQTVLVGLRAPEGKAAPLTKLPEGVLDWKTAFARKTHYVHLSPMWHSATWTLPDRTRWDWFSNFLDQAGSVSRDIEYVTPWSILEPLPGVYDWEEMSLFLDKARAQNLQVLVWPGFWGEEPAWLPAIPTQTKSGRILFDFVYDYYGVRQDYANSRALQERLRKIVSAVVKQTREHPAVQGYFLIQELPGDAPFMNWMAGYSPLEKSGYRQWIEDEFKSPATLSARWHREVASFAQIEPPGGEAGDREWLDWLLYRASGYDRLFGSLVDTVRELDPLRPLFVYCDLFSTELSLQTLREKGCAIANGGSHDAIHPFPLSEIGRSGLIQRTEDHLPGRWTGYFEEVLEASLFAMSYGGGNAMNLKHYMFTHLPERGKDYRLRFDDLRKPTWSLDQFERFIPIFGALRPAERIPAQAVELLDTEAGLLTNKVLNRNGLWDGQAQMACYRSHINFSGDSFPSIGDAQLILMIKSHLGTLTRERVEQLKAYVNGGGNLLLCAPSGRKIAEDPAADWVLLREFGFNPPVESTATRGRFVGRPVAGQSFNPGLEDFPVNGLWRHEAAEGEEVVAADARYPAHPLLSWKRHGKGRVAVVWADSIVPRSPVDGNGNLLRSVAAWAGVPEVMAADNPFLWLNLLRDPSSGRYFGLAHAGQWAGRPSETSQGTVRFRVDPAARYEVKELKSGREIGVMTGRDIWEQGIPVTLTPRQTAIFQFSPR